MTAKVKHIGIMSQNATRMFKFYESLFDFRRARYQYTLDYEKDLVNDFGYKMLGSKRVATHFDRTIIATDGNIGVAFNRRRPGYHGGLDHFGIQVDDLEGVTARIRENYPQIGLVKRPSYRTFADHSTHDPEGNIYDLMQPGKKEAKGVWREEAEKRERTITHLTIRAMNPEALAEFYATVYQFAEAERASQDPSYYLTDGTVTMVFAPWKIEDYLGTEHKRPGMDHIGFKVESVEAFKKDVETLASMDPEWLAPKTPNLDHEFQVILGLLKACPYGHHHLADPEGNLLDVAE
jgi:catechol 2,3-dioxygenase-like lactoylglutathione lyase family enzyme